MSKIRNKGLQQEELSRAKEQLQAMLESIGDGFFACKGDWRLVYVNAQAERILGIRREEVLGKSLWEIFPLTLGTRLEQECRRAAAGEIRVFENFYEPWGRWFHNRCFPREEGGIFVYFQDITERKRVEEALHKKNRETEFANKILQVFVQETGIELYEKALDLVIDKMESSYGVFGYINEHGDLMCPTMLRIYDRCDMADTYLCYPPEKWTGLWGRALLEKKTFYSNKPVIVPEGHVPIQNNLAAPILFHDKVIGLLNLANKKTGYTEEDREFLEAISNRVAPVLYAQIQKEMRENERNLAEKALQESERKFRLLFENSPAAVFLTIPDGSVIAANPAACTMLGRSEQEICSLGRSGILDIDDPRLSVGLKERQQTGRVQALELTAIRKNGERFPVEVDSVTLEDKPVQSFVIMRDITERKGAEDALHESRKDLNHAQEVGQIGSWRLDTRHNILTWSDETYRIFGVPKGTPMTYETFLAIVHPDDRQYVDTQWKAGLRGESYDIEHRIVAHGQIKWVREKAYLEFDDEGNLLGGFGITQDITEKKQAEEALRESEERYRRLFTNMTEGFALGDVVFGDNGAPKDFRFLEFNEAFEHQTGLKQEEVIGRPMTEVLPNLEQYWIDTYCGVALTGKSVRFDNYNKDTDRHYEVFCYSPIHGRFAIIFSDITIKKQAEEAMLESRRQNEFLASIIELSSQPLGVGYFDGRIRLFNKAFEQLAGYRGDELQSIDWVNTLTPPEWREMEQEKLEELRRTGRPVRYEKEYIRKDGTRVPIELLVHLMRDSQGNPDCYYAFVTNITERKQAEQALRESEERLELLAAVAERLLRAEDPQAIVEELCRLVMAHLDCQFFFNYLVEVPGWRLHLNACAGIPAEEAMAIRQLDYGVAGCGSVARDGECIIAEDIQHQDDPRTELVKSYGVQAYCCHPLLAQDKVIGTLSFGTRTRPTFTADEVALMKSVTDQVAVAMQRLQTKEAMRQRMEELEKLMDVAPVAIWVSHDPECRHIIGNRMANEFYEAETGENVSAGPAPGEPIPPRTFISGDRELRAEELPMQVAAAQNIDVRNSELEVILPSNRRIYMLGSASPLRDAQGQVRGCLGAFLNITDRKRSEDQIRESLREKEVLLKEIHHRVKNNLQIINSMLNLQLPYIKDKQAIESFKESQNRIYTMALIHEKLYQSESLARIDLAEYIRTLTTHLFISYGVSERAIRLNMHIESITLDVDRVIPCALIMNELVSNSLKYAFPDLLQRAEGVGEIRLDLRRTSSHTLTLTVSDNGIGLPEGFEIQKCESLGLKLVNVLVRQLKGNIHFGRPETGSGAECTITFEDSK
ncbi:MAG: PAS domain S-box protein [bacterium]